MFVHNRKMELALLLMTAFAVHIQPAQGLVCYDCTDISKICTTGVTELTEKATCGSDEPFCEEIEIRYPDGTTDFVRSCASKERVSLHGSTSCEKFSPYPAVNAEIKACFCQTDLCNGELGKDNASIRIRIVSQLLLFCVLVSVSVS